MVKLYYNGNRIVNKVIPSVKDSLEKVKDANLVCDDLSIPTDFEYYNTLNKIVTNISDIKTDLADIKNWLERSDRKINNNIEKLENNISELDPVDIQVRKNIIL